MLCGNLPSKVLERKGLPGKMVKIVDVEELPDADHNDDCYEIGLEEFAKKVNLKEEDDVILVAAKGKIVKVEADLLENSAKAYDGYEIEADCSCILGSGCTGDKGQQVAAGGCMDNPYKIDEDETSLLKDEDRFVIDKPSGGFDRNERSCRTAEVIPGKLVVKSNSVGSIGFKVIPDKPVVKSEPVAGNGVEAHEDGSYDHCLEMAPEQRIFDEDDDEDVVVV